MDFLPDHPMAFLPLLPHASPSKQPSHEPGYVSYPLFQSRFTSTSIDEDKENQDVRFRGGVEAQSKGIFDVGDAMVVPRPVRIKQEYACILSSSPFQYLLNSKPCHSNVPGAVGSRTDSEIQVRRCRTTLQTQEKVFRRRDTNDIQENQAR